MGLRRSVIWIDINGLTRGTLLTGTVTLAPVQSALALKSAAVVVQDWEGTFVINPSPTPLNVAFNSVEDAAILIYATVTTAQIRVTLPAPLASIFFSDGETVDEAQVAAITAAVVGTVTNSQGDVATAFVAGYRQRSS